MQSRLENRCRALYKNLPFPGYWAINSSKGMLLVRLQRPLPEMRIFDAVRGIFSRTCTRAPLRAKKPAAKRPEAPAPITTTGPLIVPQPRRAFAAPGGVEPCIRPQQARVA